MTTKQSSSVDPSFIHQVTKQLDTQSRLFAKKIHDDNDIYGWYAFCDAINLSYTIPKCMLELYFSNSTEFSSVETMHEWLMTPGGIIIMVVETLSLVTISVLGSLCSEEDKNAFNRYAVIMWPYIRDLLKALKWAYKGLRNSVMALGTLCGEDLRYLLFPMGIAFGAASILNRIWSRCMKNERKEMMKNNAKLYEEVSAKGCTLHLLAKMPDPDDKTYANSYIFLQGYDLSCSFPEPKQAVENTLYLYLKGGRIFYAIKNQLGELDEIEIKENELKEYYGDIKNNLGQAEPNLNEEQTAEIYKISGPKGFNSRNNAGLYYVGSDGKIESKEIDDDRDFERALRNEFAQNLLEVMKRKLTNVKLEGGKSIKNKACTRDLQFASIAPPIGDKTYANSFIYIPANEKTASQLIYIHFDGQQYLAKKESCEKFERELLEAQNNKNLLSFSEDQAYELIESFRDLKKKKLGFNIEEWEAYCREVDRRLSRQSGLLRAKSYFSAFAGGFFDGLYTCMGPMSIAILIPPLFLTMAIFSGAMVCLYVATCVYGEYDFQRKLFATETKVKVMLSEKKLNILLTELGRTSAALAFGAGEEAGTTIQVDDEWYTIAALKAKQKQLIDELDKTNEAFKRYKKELHEQVVFTYGTAALDGLKSGLGAYGAITSFMFLTATVCLILATPCSPIFILSCAAAAVVCMIGFLTQALLSHYVHLKKAERCEAKANKTLSDFITELKAHKHLAYEPLPSAKINKAKASIWDKTVDPSSASVWSDIWEIARSFFSGWGKGLKVGEEFTGQQVPNPEAAPVMFFFACINSMAFAVILALRAFARGFGRAPVDAVPNKTQNVAVVPVDDIMADEMPTIDDMLKGPPEQRPSNPLASREPYDCRFYANKKAPRKEGLQERRYQGASPTRMNSPGLATRRQVSEGNINASRLKSPENLSFLKEKAVPPPSAPNDLFPHFSFYKAEP